MTNSISQLFLTIAYVGLIFSLLVIRKYQKEIMKLRREQRMINEIYNFIDTNAEIDIKSMNVNNIEELDRNYQLLIKILDSINVDRKIKKENHNEEIS